MLKNKLPCLLALLFIFPSLSAQKIIHSQLIFPPQQKHVHSSSLVVCPNGDLLACWFEGSGERTADDVRIRGARLRKGAEKWSPVFEMADTPNYPDCNPILYLDNQNRLILMWVVVRANRWEAAVLKYRVATDFQNDGPPRWQWQDIILLKNGDKFRDSIRNGFRKLPETNHTWAEYAPQYERMILDAAANPVKRETGWMTRIAPAILPGGRILLPLYSDGYNLSLVAISDDNGSTWHPSAPIVGRGNIQPVILQRQSGELVAFMRDNGNPPGRIMASYSRDRGENWTPVQDIALQNPGASITALVVANGDWWMIFNDSETSRSNLSLAVSHDEGRTWAQKLVLENSQNGGRYAYPAIVQAEEGKIHLTYSLHQAEKSIKHGVLLE